MGNFLCLRVHTLKYNPIVLLNMIVFLLIGRRTSFKYIYPIFINLIAEVYYVDPTILLKGFVKSSLLHQILI